MYCAIIGDIMGSRNIKDRSSIQILLNNILEKINSKYADDIAAKFLITIGDEFQGLLKTPDNLFEIIDNINFDFHPNKLRFGIGIGDLHTELNENMAIGADGPVYYSAREAINNVKVIENKYERPTKNIEIIYQNSRNEQLFKMINVTLSLCYLLEEKWTDKQREVIEKIANSNKSQREIAKELGLRQSSIQRRINSSGYFTYKEAKQETVKFLLEIWNDSNDK